MRLVHWADEPLSEIYEVIQGGAPDKPRGLWVSDESAFGWRDWCHVEEYPCGKVGTPVELLPGHNVLILRTADQVLAFSREFAVSAGVVDWVRVAKHYDGIIITPYQPELRLTPETQWYYSWDCASGCIWRPRLVAIGHPSPS